MSPTTLSLPVAPLTATQSWQVQEVSDLDEFLGLCRHLERHHPTPFQHSHWLKHWYQNLGQACNVQPLMLRVRQAGEAADTLLLPLVRRRVGRCTFVEFADRGVTDYTGPLMRVGVTFDIDSSRTLWAALKAALPGCDVLHLHKLLPNQGQQANPLALALPVQPCALFGNQFTVLEDYEQWLISLGKRNRKEFERQWRVFTRYEAARLVCAQSVDEGLAMLRQLAAMQHLRRTETPGYFLDQPAFTNFYEDFLREHLPTGRCVVTALMVGDEMISGLLSVFDGHRFTMLRVAMGSEAWKPCAPGKLLLERSIRLMHARGCREFDFAIGDYTHKRAFDTRPLPLLDVTVALSWRGLPSQWAWWLKATLKRQPQLLRLAHRLRRP
jgi:CelD/BcsL family acetyltransferase involved in cellulose biosynthesis